MQLFEEMKLEDMPESDGGEFKPLPDGWYTACIAGAEVKDTKAGDGAYIAVRFDITGPTHEGRVVFTNLNIKNRSEVAERIGRQQLGEIMKAGGLKAVNDTDQIVGVTCEIKLTTRKSEEWGDKNEVKAYRTPTGGAPAATTGGNGKSSGKPWDPK